MMKLNTNLHGTALLASALALIACSSSSTWKGSGTDSSAVDGARPVVDSTTTDTPLGGGDARASGGASGGASGYGGGIAYDASSRSGSGGAPVVDAGAAGKDGAVASGGSGGAPTTVGSGGRSGSGGVALTGGTMGGKGGAPGTGGTSSGADASITPTPTDAGVDPPICPFNVAAGMRSDTLCKTLGSTVCRDRNSANVCACDSKGMMTCSQVCPPTGSSGDVCLVTITGDRYCYYEASGLCECLEATRSFSCARRSRPDAAPDKGPDTPPSNPSKMVSCSSDPTFSSCQSVDSGTVVSCGSCKVPPGVAFYNCLMDDHNGVCRCRDGFWNCPAVPCPAVVEPNAECDPAARTCSASHVVRDDSMNCDCLRNVGDADPGYSFYCRYL